MRPCRRIFLFNNLILSIHTYTFTRIKKKKIACSKETNAFKLS